jgi:hypothetical protein
MTTKGYQNMKAVYCEKEIELSQKRMELEWKITRGEIDAKLGKRLIDDICMELTDLRLNNIRRG